VNRKLLIVENDSEIFNEVEHAMEEHGLECIQATTMQKAIKLLAKEEVVFIGINADNIVYLPFLDVMRDMDIVPISVFTSNHDINEQLEATKKGVDHYTPLPHNKKICCDLIVMWVEMFQRTVNKIQEGFGQNKSNNKIKVMFHNDILVYPNYHRVFFQNNIIDLTPKEYEVLYLLISEPKRVFSYEQILKKVWGYEYAGNDDALLWNVIKRLRKKLEIDGNKTSYIKNVNRFGYSFE